MNELRLALVLPCLEEKLVLLEEKLVFLSQSHSVCSKCKTNYFWTLKFKSLKLTINYRLTRQLFEFYCSVLC